MFQVGLMHFRNIGDGRGNLTAIEGEKDVPFSIRRVYYITGVDADVERGYHSHKKLHQVLLCLNGSVKVRVYNGRERETILLDRPNLGLYIGPMVWREMFEFSPQCVMLVLASELYDETDYIRDFDEYLKDALPYFNGE